MANRLRATILGNDEFHALFNVGAIEGRDGVGGGNLVPP
jgi:hypothetical protein